MTPALIGLLVGVAVGFFVRRARLCSFGAIESALIGHDWRRMKVFGLALGLAMLLAALFAVLGWFYPLRTPYAATRLPWLGIVAGGLMFGFGMALVGTCAFGSLIRLGGGDLRSLMTLMIFGGVAFTVLRGALAGVRIDRIESVTVLIPGGRAALLAEMTHTGPVLALAIGATLIGLAAIDRRLWKAPKLLTAGAVLGMGVAAGWLVTGMVHDEFAGVQRVQSLTFVAPVARAMFGLAIGGPGWFDFGVASVLGVPVGAYLAARHARDFHWEAYDDPREMRRHIAGAVLMGAGGILAGGCTIGQGITAGSITSVSWLLSVPAMIIGARLGILFLVEDSFFAGIASRLRKD